MNLDVVGVAVTEFGADRQSADPVGACGGGVVVSPHRG